MCTWVYYHAMGVRELGPWKYLKHFGGPILAMAPLMFFIEIIGHLARMLSLTVRLYGNMFAGEQITNVFISLTYVVIPVIFMGLHVFVAFLQAYIFTLAHDDLCEHGNLAGALIFIRLHFIQALCAPSVSRRSPRIGLEPPPRRNFIYEKESTKCKRKRCCFYWPCSSWRPVRCSRQTPGASGGMAPGEVNFFGGMLGLGIAGGLCGIGQGKAVAGCRGSDGAQSGRLRPISGLHCFSGWCSLKPSPFTRLQSY